MIKIRTVLLTALLAALTTTAAAQQSSDPNEILRQMELSMFPDNYTMRMEMTTREPDGQERSQELSIQYRKGTGSYIEITAPARSRGTRFLQRDDTLWMYIPRSNARSAIRLAPRDSFQGSTFSNRDIGESGYTEDYSAALLDEQEFTHDDLGTVRVHRISMTPRHDQAAYGEVQAYVTTENAIPLRIDYYVRSGMHIKRMELDTIQQTAGRQRPMRFIMHALDEQGKTSTVEILELEETNNLPDRIFTQSHLTR